MANLPQKNQNFGNQLLTALAQECPTVSAYVDQVQLAQGQVLHVVGQDIGYVYFPVSSIVALECALEDGNSAEFALTGRDGIVVRPHVDPDEYRCRPGDAITLVNLSPEKGGEVFRLLAPSMHDKQFLAVRGGYGRQARVVGLNVETIPTTQDMVGDVYARTRVLLMPSETETWGRTGIEAMCSGIPVIAHPTPGLRESLGDAGIFVDRSDLAGWIAAIRDLDDPERYAAASAAASARAAEVCAQTAADLDLFAELLEGCA